ncbi:MAG: hypothetical protein PF961_02050 [Planctomycetota bacterium]|jgi:hypothetical protein|nr:hypothetical protein [Planctomycetota bacterium]
MIRYTLLLLLLCASAAGSLEAAAIGNWSDFRDAEKALTAEDVDTRMAMAMFLFGANKKSDMNKVLEEIIAIDPEHKQAHRMLGHRNKNGTWFDRKGKPVAVAVAAPTTPATQPTSATTATVSANTPPATPEAGSPALSSRAEAKQKEAQGLRKLNGRWVPEEEFYKAKKYQQFRGQWLSPSQYKRAVQREARLREITKMRSDWANAWEFDSKYFRIKTNTSHQIATEMAMAMDLCFETLCRVFNQKKNLPKIPLEIYATFDQFSAGSAQAGYPVFPGVLGYFYYGGGLRGIRCYYAGSIDQTLSTLFHECTHLVLNEIIGMRIPKWSNEGLAVFFEDAKREERNIDLEAIPWGRLWHLHRQMQHGRISLDRLVTNEFGYSVEYYPQGWSLIYFMLFAENGKYRGHFMRYYDLLKKQNFRNNMEAFTKVYGVAPNAFYDDWKKFVETLEPKTPKELISAALVAATDQMDFDRALAYAKKALTDASNEPEVLIGYARVRLYQALMSYDPKEAEAQ